jgi:hypothetical protein
MSGVEVRDKRFEGVVGRAVEYEKIARHVGHAVRIDDGAPVREPLGEPVSGKCFT